jgi:hypothetical protein
MPGALATVTLSVKDAASAQIRGIAREMANTAAVAKAMGATLDAKSLGQVSQQLNTVANNFASTNKNIHEEVKRSTSAFKEMGGALQSLTRGLGGGGIMNLLGVGGGGLSGAAAAIGAIVANSVRLALEFNKIATGPVFSMTANAGSLAANLEAFKTSAEGMADIGIGGITGAKMQGAFALSSGASAANVLSSSRSISEWAKAYGQDPVQFAQQAGLIGQVAGNSGVATNATMGQTFGAASAMGDFGRRIPEVLGTLSSVLSRMQLSAPGQQVSTRDALREIVGATSLSGSSAQVQSKLAGFQKLGGASRDPSVMATEAAAGWNMEDIITGTQDPKKMAAVFKRLFATQNKSSFEYTLMSQYGESGEQARALYARGLQNHGEFLGAAPPIETKAEKDARIKAFQASPEGQAQIASAHLENAQIKAGDAIWQIIAPKMVDITKGIDKLVDSALANGGAMDTVVSLLGLISVATAMSAGVSGLGWAKKLLVAGGMGEAAAGTAAGLAGFGVATVGALVLSQHQESAGNAGEDDPHASWRAGGTKADRAAMRGVALPAPPPPAPGANRYEKMSYLRNLWISQGGAPGAADKMARVAMNESHGDPNAVNSIGAAGLFQIYGHGKGNWLDPATNAREAVALYNQSRVAGHFADGSGMRPWADSKNKGAYGGWDSAQSRRDLEASDGNAVMRAQTHRVKTSAGTIQLDIKATVVHDKKMTGEGARSGAYKGGGW